MGFGPTSGQVKAFASQTFIQKAFKKPFSVASVLSFFFNVDYHDPSHVQAMQQGTKLDEMLPFWYAGGKDYDILCQNFQDVIRAASKNELAKESDWNNSVDGKMAQVVLCDQMARNAFRGKEEAFAGDEVAMAIAKEMSRELVSSSAETTTTTTSITIPSLKGIFYPPYFQFISSPLMHSEAAEDHELALEFLEYAMAASPDNLKHIVEQTKQAELQHKEVIDQFGRYPHRNANLGRKSTPEELEWLNRDDLPGWCKSQA